MGGLVRIAAALGMVAAIVLSAGDARGAAKPLVADLSNSVVEISTGFVGADVLLFGATDGPGDVIMVIEGPPHDVVARRKIRVGGIWVNGPEMAFDGVPSFYRIGASRPLDQIADAGELARHGIGLDNLALGPRVAAPLDRVAIYRVALIRAKQEAELYGREVGTVAFTGERLFRIGLHFPANVRTGSYHVRLFLLRDGRVISEERRRIDIDRIGVGAQIFTFAHAQPAAYGIVAILIALMAGWLAGVVFRKV